MYSRLDSRTRLHTRAPQPERRSTARWPRCTPAVCVSPARVSRSIARQNVRQREPSRCRRCARARAGAHGQPSEHASERPSEWTSDSRHSPTATHAHLAREVASQINLAYINLGAMRYVHTPTRDHCVPRRSQKSGGRCPKRADTKFEDYHLCVTATPNTPPATPPPAWGRGYPCPHKGTGLTELSHDTLDDVNPTTSAPGHTDGGSTPRLR